MKNVKLLRLNDTRFCFALLIVILLASNKFAMGQTVPSLTNKQFGPQVLPGNGLKQYDFFYAGEAKMRNMYIVRNGKITWAYTDSVGRGEISDAVLMTNGNVLFAHQYGVTLIDSNKKVLWHYDVPKNHEVHTAQPIGNNHLYFIQNGDTAKLFVINIAANKIVKQFVLPVQNPKEVHTQFRHARLTRFGTVLVAHKDMGKVREYDINGKELLSFDMPGVWSAEPLPNDDILVSGHVGEVSSFVREVNRKGQVVWEYMLSDMPDYKMLLPQIAIRLPNGNTLVNNWFNQWDGSKLDPANLPVQAIEITPGKQVVWGLRSWISPANLGPSTTIQILNDPNRTTEKVFFGNIK